MKAKARRADAALRRERNRKAYAWYRPENVGVTGWQEPGGVVKPPLGPNEVPDEKIQ